MNYQLQSRIRTLRAIERRITPDSGWVRATRETLLMQVKNTLPTEAAPQQEWVREAFRSLLTIRAGQLIRKPILAIASLCLFAIGGSLMSVSAAERSMPGDLLYGLKLATEQARLVLSAKEERLKLKTEFTGRRVQELQEVANVRKDAESVKQVAEILKRDLSTLREQLSSVKRDSSPEKIVAAAKLVDEKSNEVMNALQKTKADLSPETRKKVTEAQTVAAETGVKAIEVLVEKNQESRQTVPIAEVARAIETHTNIVLSVTQLPGSSGSPSATGTAALLLAQSLSTSTASDASSTTMLPKLMSQVKDFTVKAFAEAQASSSSPMETKKSSP